MLQQTLGHVALAQITLDFPSRVLVRLRSNGFVLSVDL